MTTYPSVYKPLKLITILLGVTCLLPAANDTNFTYLALGDSVAYGFNPLLFPPYAPATPPPTPNEFIGYPETVAAFEHWLIPGKEENASCPGETSGSFMTPGAPDYGCHSTGPQGQPPFKTSIGLHVNYPGTQLSFAVSELSTNKHINLVSLGIGSNDVLLLIAQCASNSSATDCVNAGLPAVLQTYAQNLASILTAIRTQGGYTGKLILVKYYSPTIALNPIAVALNGVMAQVGSQFGAVFADGYTAFQVASVLFGGDPCAAGLLIHLTSSTCDIHPSPYGRDLLATTVELAIAGLK